MHINQYLPCHLQLDAIPITARHLLVFLAELAGCSGCSLELHGINVVSLRTNCHERPLLRMKRHCLLVSIAAKTNSVITKLPNPHQPRGLIAIIVSPPRPRPCHKCGGRGGAGGAAAPPATELGGGGANISFCPPEILKGPQGKTV